MGIEDKIGVGSDLACNDLTKKNENGLDGEMIVHSP